MPYSNKNELSRLFGTFCHLWLKGHHAKVQMETTERGGVLAQFEIELEKPHEPFPAGLPGFRRGQSHRAPRQDPDLESGSTNAPGQPGTSRAGRRRPRRRGPKAIERSRLRSAAHQASLRAARGSAPTTTPTPIPMPPPMPPPPSLGPLSTRLIKVVPRRASSCSSFSQLQVDGQDDIGMGGSDCSETGGVEDVPPTTPLAPLQPPSPKTPPINEAGVNSPGHKSLVGVTGITDLHSDPSATCGPSEKAAGFEDQFKRHPRPLQRARSRYEARTGNSPWEKRHTGSDHHHSDLSQRPQVAQAQDSDPSSFEHLPPLRSFDRSHLKESSVLSTWEQERVYIYCVQCLNKLTDSDWLQYKNEGRDVENVMHCYPCMDSIIMASYVPPTSSPM